MKHIPNRGVRLAALLVMLSVLLTGCALLPTTITETAQAPVTDGETVKRAGCWGGVGFFTVYKEHSRVFGLPQNKCELMIQSARKLMRKPVDIHLGNHPGNNQTHEKRRKMLEEPGSNPFLDSAAWPAFLDALENRAIRFGENDD